jgi:hypothetical protein
MPIRSNQWRGSTPSSRLRETSPPTTATSVKLHPCSAPYVHHAAKGCLRSGVQCRPSGAITTLVLHPSARLLDMAFGQQQGPPASAKQVQELLALLQEAGHSDFRDARGPMGFTQRQAGGKFTRTEVDLFLERLRDVEPGADAPVEVPTWRRYPREDVLSKIASEHLAVELRRRGWTVVEP